MTSSGDRFETTMLRAGEIFIYSLWLQGQMSDLLIFAGRPDLIDLFHASPERVPDEVHRLRLERWEDDFRPVKSDFLSTFTSLLSDADKSDLEFVGALRNAIAHSHVSIGRDYLLYRPRTKSEDGVIASLGLRRTQQASDPPVVKLALDDDQYLAMFAAIKRVDELCLAKVSKAVGVQHSRIR